MSPRVTDFHRSVSEAMKAFGRARPPERKAAAERAVSGERSEDAVRERLYGKGNRRP